MRSSAFWMALASALLFGAATPISKPLLATLSPYHLAGLLYLGASLGVLGLAVRERAWIAPWRMDRTNALRMLGAVVFGGALGPLALLAGLRLASAASVSVWLNLEMVATAVLGHLLFRDHLTRRSWLAAGGILLAAMLLAWEGGVAGLRAGGLVAAACVCWGIDNHLTALVDGITPAQATFWKGLVAGATNLAIGVALAPLPAVAWIVAGALGLGALSYGLSIVLYISSAQQLGATRSQLVFSTAPFWGVLLSIVLLGDPVTPRLVGAVVLLAISIRLLVAGRHMHQHTHVSGEHTHMHAHDAHHAHDAGQSVGDVPVTGPHSHPHVHAPLTHAHPHEPDLHHRHEHGEPGPPDIDGQDGQDRTGRDRPGAAEGSKG
jgi:drug/metabolite transporter (DMT)-like permease